MAVGKGPKNSDRPMSRKQHRQRGKGEFRIEQDSYMSTITKPTAIQYGCGFRFSSRALIAVCAALLVNAVEADAFQYGDTVQANGLVWVRDAAGGKHIGEQPSGTRGTVVGGPTYKQI